MADQTNPQVTPAQSGQSPEPQAQAQPTSQSGQFKMPDKFAGKSAEDIAKSYMELERLHGETTGKYKDYDSYSKLGSPEELQQAIEWGRQVNSLIKNGMLVSKEDAAKAAKPHTEPAPNTPPWKRDDWLMMDDGAKAEAMAAHQQAQLQAYIDSRADDYKKQFEGFTGNLSRQQSVMLKAMESAIKRGGKVGVQEMLEKAAQLASLPADQLLDKVLEQMDSPAQMEAEVDKRVAAKLAEELQKRENEQLKAIESIMSPKPRFSPTPRNRAEEDRKIFEDLRRQGINLS